MFDIISNKWTDGKNLRHPFDKVTSIVDIEENIAIVFGCSGYNNSIKVYTFNVSNELRMFHELS